VWLLCEVFDWDGVSPIDGESVISFARIGGHAFAFTATAMYEVHDTNPALTPGHAFESSAGRRD
jgi:hypothetical protein